MVIFCVYTCRMSTVLTGDTTMRDFADPMWRLNNLYTITNIEGALIPLKLNEHQRYVLGELGRRNLIVKHRSTGVATLILAMLVDTCCFNEDLTTVVYVKDEELAKSVFSQIETFVDGANGLVGDPIATKAPFQITFPSGSSLLVVTSLRSCCVSMLYMMEYPDVFDIGVCDSNKILELRGLLEVVDSRHGLVFMDVSIPRGVYVDEDFPDFKHIHTPKSLTRA